MQILSYFFLIIFPYLGVVLALKVPQLCLRKQNLELVLHSLNTLFTLHQTQPTIQVQYSTVYIVLIPSLYFIKHNLQYRCSTVQFTYSQPYF